MDIYTIVIISIVLDCLIIVWLAYREFFYRVTFDWQETFWGKYKYGIVCWFWDKTRTVGKAIVHIPIYPKKRAENKDREWWDKNHCSRK